MKTQILFTSSIVFVLMSLPVWAASQIVSIKEIAISSGRLSVQVPAGDGIVLDLSEVGQTVRNVAFGDATKFVITGIDGQLCYMQQDQCEATGASVVIIRQVKGVDISTQFHSPDGSTTATLITDGKLGHEVLHLRLIPAIKSTYTAIVVKENPVPPAPVIASNSPRTRLVSTTYTSTTFPLQRERIKPTVSSPVAIKPVSFPANRTRENPSQNSLSQLVIARQEPGRTDFCDRSHQITQEVRANFEEIHCRTLPLTQRERTEPIISSPTIAVRPNTPPVTRTLALMSITSRSDANALAMGLRMANPIQKSHIKIKPRSAEYKKVQNAIIALRRGKTRAEAAKVSELNPELIDELIILGRRNVW